MHLYYQLGNLTRCAQLHLHLALPALPDLARIPPLISRAQRTGFAAATKLYEKSKDLQSAESQLYEGEELYVKGSAL